MGQLEDMRILVEAVDRGGFSPAARRLGLSKQLVSRRVSELEERLGVQLLARTTRRLHPTELGRDYLDRARRILAEADEAARAVSSLGAEPRGALRISAPLSFGLSHLSGPIGGFMTLHPRVEIDIDLNDRPVDLVAEGFDMAVRVGVLPDSTLVARRLMPVELRVVASPAYLARRGTPARVEELRDHDCLLFRHSRGTSWPFRIDGRAEQVPVAGTLRANNGEVLRDAALAGLGLAQLPGFLVDPSIERGALVSVMAELMPTGGAVYAVHPAHRQRSLSVRAFTDYLVAVLHA